MLRHRILPPLLLLVALLLPLGHAAAQVPDDPAAIEAAFTIDERKLLQEGLVLAGGYDGSIDGAFGAATRAAVVRYQLTFHEPATGLLTAVQAVRLVVLLQSFDEQYGWRQVDDPRTGSSIAIPLGVLRAEDGDDPTTSFWRGAEPGLMLRMTAGYGSRQDFQAVYDYGRRETTLTIDIRRGDTFILAGRWEDLEFFQRAEWRDGTIKDFAFYWVPPVSVPAELFARRMSVSFSPFEPLPPRVENYPTLGALALSVPSIAAPPGPERVEGSTTGIVASAAGYVVTDGRALGACSLLLADGQPARQVAEDPDTGLALLRLARPAGTAATFRAGGGSSPGGEPVALAGYPLGRLDGTLAVVPGRLLPAAQGGGLEVRPAVGAGSSGGPVIDGSGHVAAVVWGERSAIEAAWRSGEAPDDVVGALDAVQVTAFLSANGVSPQVASSGKMLTASEIEAAAGAVTVRVDCWRGP